MSKKNDPAKKESAKILANSQTFDAVEFKCFWRGCEIFLAYMSYWDREDPPCVGHPIFIVVDSSGKASFATKKEESSFVEILLA